MTPIHEIPVKRRDKAAELLIELELLKYGSVMKPLKGAHFVGDRICNVESEDGSVKPVLVEAKSVTILNPFGIDVSPKFLSEFNGLYVVIVQKNMRAEYDFLVLTSEEMRSEIEKKAKPHKWDKAHKEKRHRLKISRSLAGFERYEGKWGKVFDYKEP